MGLLDEILKQLEEAQQQGRPRPQQRRAPERESMDDEDEVERPDPAIPARPARPVAEAAPEPEPARTTADSRPGFALHEPGLPATRIRSLLSNPVALRDALIAREILGPPPGIRRLQRR